MYGASALSRVAAMRDGGIRASGGLRAYRKLMLLGDLVKVVLGCLDGLPDAIGYYKRQHLHAATTGACTHLHQHAVARA